MVVEGVCVCVCVCAGREREGKWGFGLFHWPAPAWANFSNLQTVWTQAQDSEAQDSVLQDSRLAGSSHPWTHITSGTLDASDVLFFREGNLTHGREEGGQQGTRQDEKDKWRKDMGSAILKLSETEKIRQSDLM